MAISRVSVQTGKIHGVQILESSAKIIDPTAAATRPAKLVIQQRHMAKPPLDLTPLTPEEKLQLIDELWTSLTPADFPLTAERRMELHRRLDHLDEEGPVGESWGGVRHEMKRRT